MRHSDYVSRGVLSLGFGRTWKVYVKKRVEEGSVVKLVPAFVFTVKAPTSLSALQLVRDTLIEEFGDAYYTMYEMEVMADGE